MTGHRCRWRCWTELRLVRATQARQLKPRAGHHWREAIRCDSAFGPPEPKKYHPLARTARVYAQLHGRKPVCGLHAAHIWGLCLGETPLSRQRGRESEGNQKIFRRIVEEMPLRL